MLPCYGYSGLAGEKERNSGRFPVGRFLDNWEVGSLGGGQNGWEMKTSVSRSSDVHSKWPWNPADNLKYGQIVIMLYAFLGDLDQISSFASNYEAITLPIHLQLVMGNIKGDELKYIIRPTSSLGSFFSHLPPLLAFLCNIRSLTILDYQGSPSAALWLVIKPPLWLALMCRTFGETWKQILLVHLGALLVHCF